jgi:preprotein translocase subunit SecF
VTGAEIQSFGSDREFIIRAGIVEGVADADNTESTTNAVRQALDNVVGAGKYTAGKSTAVGPKVGSELRTKALMAILLSFGAVLAYLAVRFEWRFGLAAVAATAHDLLATLAFIAMMRIEVSLFVVAALLSIVGYSLNDTIVIFDRVRENLHKAKQDGFANVLNRSVNETLPRTVLTGSTALGSLIAMAVLGGDVVRPFALIMLFGVVVGTFSSIFVASPMLLANEQSWPGPHARGLLAPAAKGQVPAGRKTQPAV